MKNTIGKVKKIPEYIRQKLFVVLSKKQLFRRKRVLKNRVKLLTNTDFTLIANNCNGCVLLHELGLRFNSQFVDLSINGPDYVKYLQSFDVYNNMELSFVADSSVPYPVGMLGDLRIDFVHYKSEEQAKNKWEERKKRINKDNMFVILTEQDECTPECVKAFDNLPFRNKVVFTRRNYSDVKSSVFVRKYENNPRGVYMFLEFENRLSIKRNYDVFDFISWFNGETNLSKLMKE